MGTRPIWSIVMLWVKLWRLLILVTMKVIKFMLGAMSLLEDYRLLSLLWWPSFHLGGLFCSYIPYKNFACNQFLQLKNVICNSFLIANNSFYLQTTMFSCKNWLQMTFFSLSDCKSSLLWPSSCSRGFFATSTLYMVDKFKLVHNFWKI